MILCTQGGRSSSHVEWLYYDNDIPKEHDDDIPEEHGNEILREHVNKIPGELMSQNMASRPTNTFSLRLQNKHWSENISLGLYEYLILINIFIT
jgi:hypothetical protein